MPRSDGRIDPGQPINTAISARAWNRAQDAADIVLGVTPGVSAGALQYHSSPYTWVYGRNGTGADLSRWSVAKIEDMYIPPNDNTEGYGYGGAPGQAQFEAMPTVQLTAANAEGANGNRTGYWCIPIEPIKQFAIGRVAVAGAVQAKIKVSNAFFEYVAAKGNLLETAQQGFARILWKEPGEGVGRWSILQLGSCSSNVIAAPFPGSWGLGEEKTLTLTSENLAGTYTETVKVTNGIMPVQASDGTGGICYLYRHPSGRPVLLGFNLRTLKGYDGNHPVLKKHDGYVQWKSPKLTLTKDAQGALTNVTLDWQ